MHEMIRAQFRAIGAGTNTEKVAKQKVLAKNRTRG